MDWTIVGQRILVSIAIGVLSGIAGFISRHWIEALLRGQFNDYVSVVKGTWEGIFEQQREVLENVSITATLRAKFNVVYGNIEYDDTKLKCVGGFVTERYISFYYRHIQSAKLQHGTILLQLSGDNQKLIGQFLGIGPLSERIVAGRISMVKGTAQPGPQANS